MKEVAILLLFALMLNGCGSSQTTAQAAEGGVWGATMLGGLSTGESTGFSFQTQFTVGSNGALGITNFQFLNAGTDNCFGTATATTSGSLTNLDYNSADQLISGTFSFTITSAAGDKVTLTSTAVTGVVNTNNNTLSDGSIIGNWTLAPASSNSTCVATSGTFTMTQTAS
ncbi:MAG: hypothetical protein ABSH02_14635 [Candidatus Sulfotelmatobacter sp.]|jgi:hypothetical protein